MNKRLFIVGLFALTILLHFISYYIPANNDFSGILVSFLALSIIPLGTTAIYSLFLLQKTDTFLSLVRKVLYGLLITIIFSIPIYFINKNHPNDYEWYYQESAFQDLLLLIVFIAYIFILIIFFIKSFHTSKHSLKYRRIVFSAIFFISVGFSVIFLLSLFGCDDEPIYFAFSFISGGGMILVTLVDLIISLFKRQKKWIKFQAIALPSWLFFMFILSKIVEYYDGNGKCELFLGPSDSGLFLTFLLIALHSYLIRKNESPTKNIVHLADSAKNEDVSNKEK